jgi:hypothetical protein
MFFGNGPEGNKFANAGVGENNIDSPLYLRDGLVETIKVAQFGNVILGRQERCCRLLLRLRRVPSGDGP